MLRLPRQSSTTWFSRIGCSFSPSWLVVTLLLVLNNIAASESSTSEAGRGGRGGGATPTPHRKQRNNREISTPQDVRNSVMAPFWPVCVGAVVLGVVLRVLGVTLVELHCCTGSCTGERELPEARFLLGKRQGDSKAQGNYRRALSSRESKRTSFQSTEQLVNKQTNCHIARAQKRQARFGLC